MGTSVLPGCEPKGPFAAETCKQKGWKKGIVLWREKENGGYFVIEITAIGEKLILYKYLVAAGHVKSDPFEHSMWHLEDGWQAA